MKRFYKDTAIDAGDGGFRVLLDGRPMRTPAKTLLVVPTEPLAAAIAGEWRDIPEQAEINVSYLALTRLAATGLDRVGSQRARVIDDTAKYGASDLLCYRAPDPASLVQRQNELWQPLLDWAAERYGASLAVAEGRLSAADAFTAAQLDELFQIERWGEDPLATQRHEGIRRDMEACARFLALLGDTRLKG